METVLNILERAPFQPFSIPTDRLYLIKINNPQTDKPDRWLNNPNAINHVKTENKQKPVTYQTVGTAVIKTRNFGK